MPDEVMTVPQLCPEDSARVCAALRTWADVLADFHAALIDSRLPADAARELTASFWEQTLIAGYQVGAEIDEGDYE